MIKRRLVFPIAGYDPVDAARHHRRFARGLVTFARTWNVNAEVSDFAEATPDKLAHWTVTTFGGNWRVEATYVPLAWNDIVLADLSRPMPLRLARFGAALFDFIRTGTAFRHFRANWKYGFFFFYPAFYLVVFAAIGAVLGLWAANLAQLEGAASALTATAVGAAAFCGLLSWLGRRWRVIQALDDWIFAYDYLHGRRPDVELRLDRFAREIAAAAREDRYDEIVVVGHSLGATLAVNVAARALDRDPALGRHGTPVCVLTVGSTIPKFTLHPGAVLSGSMWRGWRPMPMSNGPSITRAPIRSASTCSIRPAAASSATASTASRSFAWCASRTWWPKAATGAFSSSSCACTTSS